MLDRFLNSSFCSGLARVHGLSVLVSHRTLSCLTFASCFLSKVVGGALRSCLISSRTFFQYPFAKTRSRNNRRCPDDPIFPLSRRPSPPNLEIRSRGESRTENFTWLGSYLL